MIQRSLRNVHQHIAFSKAKYKIQSDSNSNSYESYIQDAKTYKKKF